MATAAGINTPAARMRFTRLKKSIEESSGSSENVETVHTSPEKAPAAQKEKGKKRTKSGDMVNGGSSNGNDNGKTKTKAKSSPAKDGEQTDNKRASAPMTMSGVVVSKSGNGVGESGESGGDDDDDHSDEDGLASKKQKTR